MENTIKNQNISSLFQTKTAKIILIGMLSLVLLIPLEFVKSLIAERTQRKKEMVNEVTETWGKDVHFYGPILRIPYSELETYTTEDPKTHKTTIHSNRVTKLAYFFPEKLKNNSEIIKNDKLKRGLYHHVVFSATMNFDGFFGKPNFEKLGIKPENVQWEKAAIIVKTTNLKSIKSDLKIKANQEVLTFESSNQFDNYYHLLESNLFDYRDLQKENAILFSFQMKFNGSNSVKFIPIGKTTTVQLISDWSAPSYEGAFAKESEIKDAKKEGFTANWKVMEINRTFAQQYTETIPDLNDYLFGVKLIETVDEYQQNERASKYGFLVIGLTFLVFFLIQTISKINIHIFQYLMIGLALIMFYTLLISITEHSSFTIAYIIAAIAVIVMLVLYAISILKNNKVSMFIGASLLALYCFIFVIIQLENYALLVGSIGLFLILGAIMYFSRKIDWQNN